MKKMILILIVAITTGFSAIGQKKLIETNVTYSGQSDKAYYFTDTKTSKTLEFSLINKIVLSKIDLTSKKNIGKSFTITYEIDPIEIKGIGDDNTKVEVKEIKNRFILMGINKILEGTAHN